MKDNAMRPGDFRKYLGRVSGAPVGQGGEGVKDALRSSFDKYSQERRERQERLDHYRQDQALKVQEIWSEAGRDLQTQTEPKEEE